MKKETKRQTDQIMRFFLKSGIPLEWQVSRVLQESGLYVSGEYEYERVNEQKVVSLFSCDVRAFDLLELRREKVPIIEEYLVECKYCSGRQSWVFLPVIEDPISGVVAVESLGAPFKIEQGKALYDFDDECVFVSSGACVSSEGFNRVVIQEAVHQLMAGAVDLYCSNLEGVVCNPHESDSHVRFQCPIIVTNAELRVIKQSATLRDIESTVALEEVTDSFPWIVLEWPSSGWLEEHAMRLVAKHITSNDKVHEVTEFFVRRN